MSGILKTEAKVQFAFGVRFWMSVNTIMILQLSAIVVP